MTSLEEAQKVQEIRQRVLDALNDLTEHLSFGATPERALLIESLSNAYAALREPE